MPRFVALSPGHLTGQDHGRLDRFSPVGWMRFPTFVGPPHQRPFCTIPEILSHAHRGSQAGHPSAQEGLDFCPVQSGDAAVSTLNRDHTPASLPAAAGLQVVTAQAVA